MPDPAPPPADAAAVDTPVPLDLHRILRRVETQLLGGPRQYTRLEVAERTGIDLDTANRLWRALGFASTADEDKAFSEADVEVLRLVRDLSDKAGIDTAQQIAITRMLGQAFARLASWQGQLLLEIFTERPELLASEDGVVDFLQELAPELEAAQVYVWRRQLFAYFARLVAQADAAQELTTEPRVVGFADMSGFTTLTRSVGEAELRALLETFEDLTTNVVGEHRGRIVKTIGDEVLFVADEPRAGAEIALELLDAGADLPALPPLRIGVAAGPVVSRLGDVYGEAVNIASRLTSLARPGWVLIDRTMAEALDDDADFVLHALRPENVRGYSHLRQWRLRRAGDEDGQRPARRPRRGRRARHIAGRGEALREKVEAMYEETVARARPEPE